MANVLAVMGIVTGVLNLLPKLINCVERLFGKGAAGQGPNKKDAVLGLLFVTWETLKLGKVKEIKELSFETQVKPVFSDLIDDIVALYNLAGVFKK